MLIVPPPLLKNLFTIQCRLFSSAMLTHMASFHFQSFNLRRRRLWSRTGIILLMTQGHRNRREIVGDAVETIHCGTESINESLAPTRTSLESRQQRTPRSPSTRRKSANAARITASAAAVPRWSNFLT
jgi:hypothetical protein